MKTVIQLARAGDILSIIPAVDALRNGERVNWLVAEPFASILENLSWVNVHIFKGSDSGVPDAIQYAKKYIGGEILATQVNGNPEKRSQSNFILQQWHLAGKLEQFHDLPLAFDNTAGRGEIGTIAFPPEVIPQLEERSAPTCLLPLRSLLSISRRP